MNVISLRSFFARVKSNFDSHTPQQMYYTVIYSASTYYYYSLAYVSTAVAIRSNLNTPKWQTERLKSVTMRWQLIHRYIKLPFPFPTLLSLFSSLSRCQSMNAIISAICVRCTCVLARSLFAQKMISNNGRAQSQWNISHSHTLHVIKIACHQSISHFQL